ncbi:Protein F53A9.3, partial [Aphelenchoides avenae]
IPLVSICYIESAEQRTTLDVRGKRFRCWMMGVGKAVEDTRDWLRFLVVRQRIPHSILGLSFDWDKNETNQGPPRLKKTSTTRSKSSEGYSSMKSPFGGSVYSLLDSVCSSASS